MIVMPVAALVAAAPVGAQELAVKRTLSGRAAAPQGPCTATPRPPANGEPSAEARRFTALGHEAALAGDQRSARDLFMQAAALAPDDERVAYHLARAYEELGETPQAVREYCRYLSLAPAAPDTGEVRARLTRLAPSAASEPSPARARFDSAVGAYERRQYAAASDGFASVITLAPDAPEPYYNRALALSARGDRAGAAADFQRYLEHSPNASDRLAVQSAIRRLMISPKSVPAAFALGLVVPGGGQFYTGHKWRGALVLALAGGAFAYSQRQTWVVVPCTHPNAQQVGDHCETNHYPNYDTGLALTAATIVAGAIEAAFSAHSRNRGLRSGTSVARSERASRDGGLDVLAPAIGVGPRGGMAISLPVRF
jgi:Tfp pilus assembly protein PilF